MLAGSGGTPGRNRPKGFECRVGCCGERNRWCFWRSCWITTWDSTVPAKTSISCPIWESWRSWDCRPRGWGSCSSGATAAARGSSRTKNRWEAQASLPTPGKWNLQGPKGDARGVQQLTKPKEGNGYVRESWVRSGQGLPTKRNVRFHFFSGKITPI